MTERFKNAYAALVDAYYNDTLMYNQCEACAVGSIVARANDYKVVKDDFGICEWKKDGKVKLELWSELFCAGCMDDMDNEDGLSQIEPTGYTAKELFDVEGFYFEISRKKENKDKFTILCNLVDFLLKLDDEEPRVNLHEGFKIGKEKAKELVIS